MKNISMLAIKELKSDKKMVLTMMIGIIIVTILINSVVTLALSYQEYIMNVSRSKNNWEAKFDNIKYSDVKTIENDENIKQISVVQDIGTSEKSYETLFEKYVHIKAYDTNALENLNISLKEGRYPQNSNEILINKWMGYKIGDKFETIINGKENSYEIVGMLEETEFDKNDSANVVSTKGAITFLNREGLSENDNVSVSVITNDISKIYKTVERISEKTGKVARYNEELLTYGCIAKEGSEFKTNLIITVSIAIAIVSISSIALIYTVFNVSVSEKKKYIASLLSIGTTRRQIFMIYLLEGIIIIMLALPLGLLLSFGLDFSLINIFNKLFKTLQGNILGTTLSASAEVSIYMVSSWFTTISSIILIITICLISIVVPIINISKTTIIEGIRKNKYNKMNSNNVKSPKVFGLLGGLAYKNISRSKSKYIVLTFSVTISIILFITINGYISNLNSYNTITTEDYNYRLSISNNWDYDKREYSKEIIEEFKEAGLIESVYGISNGNGAYTKIANNDINPTFKEMAKKLNSLNKNMLEDNSIELFCTPIILDNKTYEEYLKQVGDIKLEKNECVLINYSDIKTKYGNGINFTNYEEGDKLTLYCNSEVHPEDIEMQKKFSNSIDNALGTKTETNYENKSIELNIKKVTNVIPKGAYINVETGYIAIVVTPETLDEIDLKVNGISFKHEANDFRIQSPNTKELDMAVQKLADEYRGTVNIFGEDCSIKQEASDNERIIKEILLYSFIVLICVLSIINIFNIIVSSMRKRKMEIVQLSAIGMDRKQMNKMLILEGIFYGLTAIIIGIIIGITVIYILYTKMINIDLYEFEIPYIDIVCMMFVIYLVIFSSIAYVKKEINSKNISDIIKEKSY